METQHPRSATNAELAARIPDFGERFEAGVTRGASRFAASSGLLDEQGEAPAERRLILAALRGLAIETALAGDAIESGRAVISLLRRIRGQFYDSHRAES